MPPRRRTTRRKRSTWDDRGDQLWKWLMRLSALGAFFYTLIAKNGDVPLGVYVLIGGMAGLPNIWGLQRSLNERADPNGEEGS